MPTSTSVAKHANVIVGAGIYDTRRGLPPSPLDATSHERVAVSWPGIDGQRLRTTVRVAGGKESERRREPSAAVPPPPSGGASTSSYGAGVVVGLGVGVPDRDSPGSSTEGVCVRVLACDTVSVRLLVLLGLREGMEIRGDCAWDKTRDPEPVDDGEAI